MPEAPPQHRTCYRFGPASTGRAWLVAAAIAIGMALPGAVAAKADLKLCNNTAGRIGVAIGYQSGKGWATEG